MTLEWPTVAIPHDSPPLEAVPPQRQGLASELLSPKQLKDLPPVRPLIEDTIPLGGVSLLAGRFSTAKSFMALSMALSVATGSPWYGREVVKRRTLYVAAEGVQGMAKRLDAWERATGLTVGENFQVIPRAIQLGVTEEIDSLRDLVSLDEFGFVIIDTLSKSTIGLEENSNSDMSRAVDVFYKLRDTTGDGSVLVVHHTGKDGTTIRGASALEAGVDVVYLATAKDQTFQMERKKNKDGPVVDKRSFSLETPPGAQAPVLSAQIGTDIPAKAQELLSVMSNECRNGSGIRQSELRKLVEWSSSTFTDSRNRLIDGARVVSQGEGRNVVLYLKGDEPL